MKMYSNYYAILLIALIFSASIQSCTKGEFSTTPEVETPKFIKNTCPSRDLGFAGLQEGQMHNDLVMLITENYSICSNNIDDITNEIKQILKENSQPIVESYGMNFAAFRTLVDTAAFSLATTSILEPVSDPIHYIENHNVLSPILKSQMIGLVKLLDEIGDNTSVDKIQGEICYYYYENVGNLTNNTDIMYFGSMVDVALHSVAFWSPSSNGGNNGYYNFSNSTALLCAGMANDQVGFRIDWGKVFSADAVGVIAGATRAVLSNPALAVPNPALGGIPTAGVVGVVSGVASSVIAGIG